ncbi:MAG TPA: DUF4397 domain-containing protein, partial [Candidatus Kapabacteria bacterium]|nr:DUF4397 domain-containing protein [Candidatus Kapabacteria bacterium]
FLFLFVAFFGLTGCEKIVEVEKTVYDTLTVRDTTEVPRGPAYVRFVSLLPNRNEAGVALYLGPSEMSAPFGLAGDRSRNEFIPIKPREALKLYAFYYRNSVKTMDSILLPPFEPTEMYTCAVFGIEDPDNGTMTLEPHFSWDSLRTVPPSAGKAYLRLINALADFPVPTPVVNLKIKSFADTAIFAQNVQYREIANYIEVPTGSYQIYLTVPGESGYILNTVSQNIAEGAYYTAMVFGRKSDNTAKLFVGAENWN